jgi:bifunctional DNA-binding transcriptional regulator/antitoxin component of YhaV-PrlF toxin-antitoxin module
LPIEFEVKVVEVGNSLRIAIPVEILRAIGIQKGDMLLMTTNDSQIVIRKPSASPVRKKKG